MRFATKFDRWLVVLLGLTALVTCVVMPAMRLFAPGAHPAPLPVAFFPIMVWAIVLPCTLPQYYEVREQHLFIRQGWRKISLPYDSLVELQFTSDSRSGVVFSTDRILVVTQAGKRYVIAPAEQERFLEEVARRAPQLERRPHGLGFPLSSPTVS